MWVLCPARLSCLLFCCPTSKCYFSVAQALYRREREEKREREGGGG